MEYPVTVEVDTTKINFNSLQDELNDWWTYELTESQRLVIKASIYAALLRSRSAADVVTTIEQPDGGSCSIALSAESFFWGELISGTQTDLQAVSDDDSRGWYSVKDNTYKPL